MAIEQILSGLLILVPVVILTMAALMIIQRKR